VRKTTLCLGLSAVVIVVSAVAARQDLSSPVEAGAFVAALETCAASKMRAPHPLMASFVVDHTILGEENGACGYTQTMPGKMTMVCALTPSGRKQLAADMKVMTSGGAMRAGTSQLQPGWFKECQIELPNGNRVPAGQTK